MAAAPTSRSSSGWQPGAAAFTAVAAVGLTVTGASSSCAGQHHLGLACEPATRVIAGRGRFGRVALLDSHRPSVERMQIP